MTDYNARATLRTTRTLDDVVDELAEHHAAASPAGRRLVEAVITVPAESLRQATVTALALLERAGHVETLEVVPTAVFDARNGLAPLPQLVSVTEAADALGVTRQAVLQRLEAGTLPGTKVGATWAIPAAAVSG